MDDRTDIPNKYQFGQFRLDLADAQISHLNEPVNLTPKAFSVLTQLVQANGSLVRKDDLFDTVWAGTVVSESALTVCIREIRKVLGDCSKKPEYIETVHKRGYRFVAKITTSKYQNTLSKLKAIKHVDRLKHFIDREQELHQLDESLALAKQGQRQIVFVTGEAGIGKTSFIDACQARFEQTDSARSARGQCVMHHGRVEPYLPWLDAMTDLCSKDDSALDIFKRIAPMWLLHTPSLLSQSERSDLEISLAGVSGERMLREMINVLNELTVKNLLVVYLDDMHFSDLASLELLSSVAHRREQAKLLIVATFRPIEKFVVPAVSEIKQELMVRYLCSEVVLKPFSLKNICDYINYSFEKNKLGEELASAILESTNGNPLFVMNVIQHLVKQKQLQNIDGYWNINCELNQVVSCIPENLIQLIGSHIDKLSPQIREILEVAAVASDVNTKDGQFSVIEVAHALEADPTIIESRCDQLVEERHLLNSVETGYWPDGTMLIRYAFNHSLYKRALYQSISPGRRAILHHRLGQRLESAYKNCETQIALKLAIHYEQGRDYELATHYLKTSAETAFQLGLNTQAINSLRQALELSMLITDKAKRQLLEMEIYTSLGTILIADKGNDAPEVEKYFSLARDLANRLDDKSQLFRIIFGLRSCCLFSGRLKQAHQLSKELFDLASELNNDDLIVEANVALCSTANFLGEFEQTLNYAKSAINTYSSDRYQFHVANYGLDPGVYCHGRAAKALLCLGYPDQALNWAKRCLKMAQQIDSPYTMAFALNKCAWINLLRKDAKHAEKWANQAITLSENHGYTFFVTWANIIKGWSLVAQGDASIGLKQIQNSLDLHTNMADGVRSYLLTVYADACLHAKAYLKGIEVLNNVVEGAEYFFQADRLHIRAKLMFNMIQQTDTEFSQDIHIIEAYLLRSIECATTQQAKWYEIQAKTTLAEHLHSNRQSAEAYDLLHTVEQWFTQGQSTSVIKHARDVLKKIDSPG